MIIKPKWWIGLAIAGLIIIAATYCSKPAHKPSSGMNVSSALGGGDNAGYQRAYQPRLLQFPTDHGPHPDFRNEWWYVTGNLADAQGRQFGYQLTLFRIALSPTAPVADSIWRSQQVYMGHFALTDVLGQEHYGFERFSRGAAGLAGAQAAPFRVWLENWQLMSLQSDLFPLRIQAEEQQIKIDLTLNAGKAMVLQGNQGLSQKSAEPGNASYYYSYTRLPTQGVVTIGDQSLTVSGASWLDREWSTSALGPDQSGWDWFALQLDDGRDLMFYRLRRKDGGMDLLSQGVLVASDGQARLLRGNELELQPIGAWTSSDSGDRYPASWRLRLPAEQLNLTITPKVADQEMRLSVRYWEGAVAVNGQASGKAISGQGYLEMTRYESLVFSR